MSVTSAKLLTARAILALSITVTSVVEAQTFKVLYTFTGGADGGVPVSPLLLYEGKLYGAASSYGEFLCGNVFQVDIKTGIETVVYSFRGGTTDGADPQSGIIRDPTGNLYGTTSLRGSSSNAGTVFQIYPSGTEAVLHRFSGRADGSIPFGGLVRDSHGDLYGVTQFGGRGGVGTVFQVDTAGNFATLHTFQNQPDGAHPSGALLLEGGKLYGATTDGGTYGHGMIFELAPGRPPVLTPVYNFSGGANGLSPYGSLISDGGGNLYGTASCGGSSLPGDVCVTGFGVVFQVNIATGQETVLHSFSGSPGDGDFPVAGVVRDAQGNLYGTTNWGGADNLGIVFKLDSSGTLSTLHSFTGQADGSRPTGGVIVGSKGRLSGSTAYGGAYQAGTIFEIVP